VGQTEALARVGLSEPETAVTRLAEAYRPLAPIRDFIRRLLGLLGISGLERGLGQVLSDVLHAADPIRVARIFRPIFTAIRGRLTAFVDAVVAPLKGAVSQIRSAIDLLNLGALSDGVSEILDTVKAEIMTLAPGTLLAPTLAALDTLRAQVIAFDPLAELQALLTALAEQAAGVIDRLDPDRLLAEPARLYDEIVAILRSVQVDALLAPILDELDALAADVDDGLTRTADAIGRLQAALPSSGGGVASVGVELAIG
jgi:hypothetical protein